MDEYISQLWGVRVQFIFLSFIFNFKEKYPFCPYINGADHDKTRRLIWVDTHIMGLEAFLGKSTCIMFEFGRSTAHHHT